MHDSPQQTISNEFPIHVCAEKQSAVKPCDAIGGKEEEPALFVVSWRNTQRSPPLPYRLSYLQNIYSFLGLYQLILIILFLKI